VGNHLRFVVSLLPPSRQLNGGSARLLQGALALLYVVHAFSCSWLFVSSWLQPSHVGAPSWIAADKQCAEWAYVSASSVYLRAVYFSITVLSTVGYGDIRPQTRIETGFMLVEVVVSAAFLSSLIGLVSSYFRNRDFEEETLKSQLDYLYHYMQHRKLPRRLQQRISNYYLLIWSNARVSQANTLQAALPLFIQRDMRLFMHREMIRKIPLLRKVTFFPMKDLCLQLRATVALTGDLVCERNTTASEMYFVDFGTLLVLPRMDARPGSTGLPGRVQRRVTVTDGGFFGSEMLCINSPNGPKPYEDTVEALSNCHLFYITSKVWEKLCDTYDELAEISHGEWRNRHSPNVDRDTKGVAAKGKFRRTITRFMKVGLGYGDESPVGDCRPTPNMMHASSTVTPMMRSNSTVATSLSALVRSQSTVGGVGRKVSAMFKGASRPDVLHISRVSHGSSGHGSSGLPSWSAREKSDSRQSRQSRSQRMSRDRKSHSR